MPDQLSRKDIKQVDVLVYTTLENPGEQWHAKFTEDFLQKNFQSQHGVQSVSCHPLRM